MLILKDYALSFVGTPYSWGGSNPMGGFDCSGFVQELLASVGMDPPGDQSAQALYDYFEKNSTWNTRALGSLAFFGQSSTSVTHVAMMLDQYRIIEAGGGGSKVLSIDDAKAHNSYIRVRLLNYRKDLVAVMKPSYVTIGSF